MSESDQDVLARLLDEGRRSFSDPAPGVLVAYAFSRVLTPRERRVFDEYMMAVAAQNQAEGEKP